jgi:class 3 adenylate cyclase/tetratricopeptide (TPR) repeat protein
MNCPACHFENPAGMKFCGQCGAKLALLCPACGAESPPGFKFCGACGARLEAAPAAPPPAVVKVPPASLAEAPAAQSYTPAHLASPVFQSQSALEGERKQVTVLFCDLVGSTALAERLGPEAMHLVLNQFFELALAEVHRYEGTINQFLGDGFMALFGAPIAHEDHARRAALAAIGLQRSLGEHEAELHAQGAGELRFRMGINTGWVVVAGIGDQLRRDYTAIGDTTNLAARLQAFAEPGTILVSEDTARFLQGSARLDPLPPFQVKGKEAPVKAARLLGVGLLPSEDAVLGGAARTPFVGRRREMATLVELRERAAAGEGQVVGIAAEAGSGKSRLLYEFRRRLWGRPVLHLAGRCLSYASGIPYLPIVYLLRNAWQIGEGDDAPTVTAKVRAGLEGAEMEVAEALPFLLVLLGVEEGTEPLAELSAQARQSRTFRLVRQVILNLSRRQLVILELEDLHWVDPTSEELLALVVEGLFAAPVLLVATYRSGYRPPWIEKSYSTQIPLARLSDTEGEAVMRSVLARTELPAKVLAEVLGKAEGNPFFLEELTRSFLEHPDVGVPDTIQGVLLARIDRLPEAHKRLLQTCSVLGREFTLRLLGLVWASVDELTPLVTDLKRWEFLYEEPTADEPRYLFKHALTQETVYGTLLKGRRQSLHGAAGRAFETIFEGRLDEAFDNLAHHFSAAGEPKKAVSYLVSSARRSAASYAHAEAEAALRRALGHCRSLPKGESDRCAVEIGLLLAESLLPLARFPATLELFADLAERVERLADPALAGRYHFWLAHTHSYLGDQAAAEANAREAIAAARRAGDVATEGRAWYVLCRDAFWSGRFSEGIEHGRQATTLLEQAGDQWWQGQADGVAGFHHYVLGQFDQAFEHMRRADALWRALQDPRLDPSWSTGYFHASLGRTELGIDQCQAGAERAQDPLNRAAALGFLGYAHLEREELVEAEAALSEAVEAFRQAGMPQLLGWFSAFLADTRLRAGRAAEAEGLAKEALAATEAVGFRYGSGLAQRVLGRIAQAAGDRPAAEAWQAAAILSFESIGAPFEVARTRLEAARAAGPGTSEAAAQLGAARSAFTELRVPAYVARAEALAGELAAVGETSRRTG